MANASPSLFDCGTVFISIDSAQDFECRNHGSIHLSHPELVEHNPIKSVYHNAFRGPPKVRNVLEHRVQKQTYYSNSTSIAKYD